MDNIVFSPKTDAILSIDSYSTQAKQRHARKKVYFRPKPDAVLHTDPYLCFKNDPETPRVFSPKTDAILSFDSYSLQHKPSKDTPANIYIFVPKRMLYFILMRTCTLRTSPVEHAFLVPKRMLYCLLILIHFNTIQAKTRQQISLFSSQNGCCTSN